MHPNEPKRIELAYLPTPIVELKSLARDLGVPRILLKRDDLTGAETTGNKVRKLEYVVADAIAKGATSLVTHGGYQSNHCRSTAAIGARLGLSVRLFLRAPKEGQADLEGNLFLDHFFGAKVTMHAPEEYNTRRKQLIETAMEDERRAGKVPYFFPVGASIPLGVWGYVRCVEEMVQQLGRGTKVDVFSAVSSAGTHAGLMVGKALFGLDNWRMVGIPVSDSIAYFQKELRDLVTATSNEYHLGLTEAQTPIDLIDGFIGEGYAIPYDAAVQTIKRIAKLGGIAFDPVYTGKGVHGMVETIRRGGVRPGAIPLFIHTGGIFGLMARRDLFS